MGVRFHVNFVPSVPRPTPCSGPSAVKLRLYGQRVLEAQCVLHTGRDLAKDDLDLSETLLERTLISIA